MQWTNWNKEEFIHSALIMIEYHRLASVCEALKIKFFKSKEEIDIVINQFHNLNIIKTEEQHNLFDTITSMNFGKEVQYSRKKKKSEDFNSKFNGNNQGKTYNEIDDATFTKHINKFCTAYQDFDVYEQDQLSALVYYFLYKRNLIG